MQYRHGFKEIAPKCRKKTMSAQNKMMNLMKKNGAGLTEETLAESAIGGSTNGDGAPSM